MKNDHKEISVWIQLLSFLCIWVVILWMSDTGLIIGWEAVKKLPEVVTIYVFAGWVFTKWAWRLPIFGGWVVTFPDLQGTWQGTIESTWVDPVTGQKAPLKNVTLVIRQTFSSISCVMYTDESSSSSVAAQISTNDESELFWLSYNYTNRSSAGLRQKSPIHDGAAILKVIAHPDKKLEGEYWTNRKTTGDISVKFVSKKLANSYQGDDFL